MDAAEFREQDREWRRRLQGLSLVAEAAIDVDSAIAGLQTLASKVFTLEAAANRTAMMKRYAPTALAGLTAVASAKYDEGTFWPRVGEVAGLALTQLHQQLFSNTFRYGLDLLGLSRFDTPLRNLGEILMHAGIPLTSLRDYMQVLQKRDAAAPDLTGVDFCAWARSMSRAAAATKGMDAPTWRFLSSGGDVSADFVDRFLAVFDELASGAAPSGLALDSLPSHVAEEVRRLLTTGAVRRSGSRSRAREARLVPRLVYVDGMIQIHLPAFEERWRRDVTWQLTVAGESWTRVVAAPWSGDPALITREPLSKPQVDVVVRLKEESVEWVIPVVDPEAPLLVFDLSTRAAVPLSAQLPKGRAWIAFPNEADRDVHDAIECEGDLIVLEHPDAPYGWDDWSFALVDLTRVTRIRARAADTATGYRWRYVNSVVRPALEDVETVPFVRTLAGGRVLCRRPRVVLPPARLDDEVGAQTTMWTITVLSGAGELLRTLHVASSIEPMLFDPWPKSDERLTGEFSVKVLGPLGRGAVLDVTIAEEVTVTAEPEFRWFEPSGGLESCLVNVSSPDGNEEAHLRPDMRERQVVLGGDNDARSVTVLTDVDHMWLSTVSTSGASRGAIGPARIHRENLATTELRLNTIPRVYGQARAVAGGTDVQSIDVQANATGIARLNLAHFADTAEKHGVLSIHYEAVGRSTVLCKIRPRQLISEISVSDSEVSVVKNGDSVPLELGVYMDYAPWRLPETFEIPVGVDVVPAPASLQGRGPAWVATRVMDPWATESWPKYPSTQDDNCHHVEMSPTSAEGLEDAFIAWVAGEGELPDGPNALAFAIEIYGSLAAARTTRPRWELRQDIAQRTHQHGWEFVEIARDSKWSRATHTRLLAEGWAATASASDRPVDRTTWTLSPLLGLLESFGIDGPERLDLDDLVIAVLGDAAGSILSNGVDPYAAVGAFRHEVEILSTLPKAQVDEIFRVAAPVPGALLNADQRLIHARELFDGRLDSITRDLARTSHGVLERTHAVLQAELGDRVRVPIGARSGSDGWPSLPCISISFSLLARLAARGSSAATETFERYRSRFGDLASAAPSIVEQDLVLAELWMTRWESE
jgi:hypothetical protein